MTETMFLNHATGVDGGAMPIPEPAITLRDYQEASVRQLSKRHQAGKKRIILCLPTGAGKTVTFSEICKRALEAVPQGRVLILTDRTELLHQAATTLQKAGLQAGILNADAKHMPRNPVIVAMVETYYRRVKKGWTLPDLQLIIIDEAHKGNFRKVIDLHADMPIIGATATPMAASKEEPLRKYFEDIVVGTEIHLLIEAGYLSQPRYFAVPMEITAGKGADGDYKTSELFSDFDKPALYSGCVANQQKHAPGKKTLVFCVNIAHTLQTASFFAQVHEKVRYVTSDTPAEERQATLRWFSQTSDAILVNCGILTTGFDEPTVECVILNRATRSLPLYLQMCGRGSRTTAAKREFIVIDMGNNITTHGLWHAPRDWEYIFWNGEEKTKTHEAPVKPCPQCASLLPAGTKLCPHCGQGFHTEAEPQVAGEEIQTQELEIDWSYLKQKSWSDMSVTELIQRAIIGNVHTGIPYKPRWIIHCMLERDNPRPLLEEFAQLKGYHPGWVDKCLAEHARSEASRLIRQYALSPSQPISLT